MRIAIKSQYCLISYKCICNHISKDVDLATDCYVASQESHIRNVALDGDDVCHICICAYDISSYINVLHARCNYPGKLRPVSEVICCRHICVLRKPHVRNVSERRNDVRNVCI
ncbi:hypothetical protein ATCV1_z118R [Acanthocystis turfacea chlorella virus 1]|uniref:Uncharacterized protein z118R n=1 Tax=Chlorovirus heliozoae TaxID=322019 RepID=A7K878_9PHYC|nr:hypothetical protein ATCV1_z118R [Acanthocystis turfacea chlorella virus 1]ABT16252.1 hypothetical protein ATCV1_z118R [Acanthocystis turfacea chlorella virus 1]